MTKDLTTVTRNRIRYWQWSGIMWCVSDGRSSYQYHKGEWHDITGLVNHHKDPLLPDSAVLLSGIPLAYTQTNNEASEPHK